MDTSCKTPKIIGGASATSKSEGIDRISSLPDDVIHNILSPLCIFDDVLHLSVLSTRWNKVWRTLPYLEFDINRYGCERVNRPSPWDITLVDKFKDFINWIFNSQCTTSLVRFKLCCGNLFDKMTIFRWICLATRRNVQEIVLRFRLAEPFELPHCVAVSESLRVLVLGLSGALLKLPNHLGFRQLKLLHLMEVELSNERLTSCLFSKCPLLEILKLGDCSLGTMTVLDIASTSLVHLSIKNYNAEKSYISCIIKISCPKLKVFKYDAPMAKDIIMEHLFSIEIVSINFYQAPEEVGALVHNMINNVPTTSVLEFTMCCVRGLHRIPHAVKNSLITLYKLKSLNLDVGIDEECMQVMLLLLKHSPNLEVLSLWSDEEFDWSENWKLEDPSENIVCLESRLKLIQLTGFKYDENEMEILRFFLKNARVLEKLMVVWAWYYNWKGYDRGEISKEASEVVSKYPRSCSRVVVTFHDVNRDRKFSHRHRIVLEEVSMVSDKQCDTTLCDFQLLSSFHN